MYLHLGGGVVIPTQEILAVCDLDNASSSHRARRFCAGPSGGRVVNVAEDLPKSFVLCAGDSGPALVYLSQLSSATLLRRAETDSFE